MEIKIKKQRKVPNRLGGSTYRIHFVLRSFVDMANSYGRVDCRKNIDNFVLEYNNTDRKED